MYRFFTIGLLIILLPLFSNGQTIARDTLFFSIDGEAVEKSKADYYKFFLPKESKGSVTEKTFYKNHSPRTIIHFSDNTLRKKTDTSKAFYQNGSLHWFIVHNLNGSPTLLKQFYKNGQLKRIELNNGKSFKGKKYNSDGKRIRFSKFQQAPKYMGGNNRMVAYLNRTIKYPKPARDKDIKGTVYVSFVITKNGKVSNPKIIESVHPLLDKEALRVVRIMKQWVPAKTDDKAVNSKISIPITFGKPYAQNHIPAKN